MEITDVPLIEKEPDTAVNFAEYLLTSLFSMNGRVLYAQCFPICGMADSGNGDWHVCSGIEDHVVATTPSKGIFRSVLARFGHHYMAGQMYGGYAERVLTQAGRRHVCGIYMANDQWRGYWIRIYTR